MKEIEELGSVMAGSDVSTNSEKDWYGNEYMHFTVVFLGVAVASCNVHARSIQVVGSFMHAKRTRPPGKTKHGSACQ